jgi:hypothetical protein
MFDDLRQTINKIRGDFSGNKDTSIAVGREAVQDNLEWIYGGVYLLLLFGVLKFKDAVLLAVYGGTPFVLDSGLFLQSVPLLSRVLPRVTVLIELGMEFGAVSVGISLGVVYAVYRLIGAVKMGVPYYSALKRDD